MLHVVAMLLVAGPRPAPVVAIDAGHGGEQHGAIGVCGAKEKDVALSISLHLARLLSASGKATPLLLRPGDTTVGLDERAAKANQARATLFVSIHANAGERTDSSGVETYFLSRHTADRRTAEVAARENDGRPFKQAGSDDELARILEGLILQAAHQESQRLAMRVQEAMNAAVDTRGRGVLQAPFIVLRGARMPAVLVEVGFLTNVAECQSLADDEHRRRIAQSIAAAVLDQVADDSAAAARP